jgi:hypothetical protein
MAFDVEGARKAGYSEAEIVDHLSQQTKFDAGAARKAGYSDAEIIQHLRAPVASFAAQPEVPEGTSPSKLKGSSAGGVVMGLRDSIDAGAQLLVRGANAIGLAPDSEVAKVDKIVKAANAEYDASRKLAGRDGIDIARVAGNIANPVNRVVPMGGAASTASVAARAGAQGTISGVMQPVTNTDDFASEKGTQAAVGGLAGAAGGALVDKLVQGAGSLWAQIRARPMVQNILQGTASRGALNPAAEAEILLNQTATQQGIDLAQIPKSILDDVRGKVQLAISQGKTLDGPALLRQATGRAVLGDDAALLTGQVTRDPQEFARDIDLRGIAGAGKPIADRLNLQNTRLIEILGKQGAKGAPDAYDAGKTATEALQKHDEALSTAVRDAYTKFRKATGSSVDVPLQPLAQRLGEVVERYGNDNIPSAVRAQLNAYGLGGAKQTKVFDLLEADKLIKTINANFDPMKGPQMAALGELRSGLNDAIELAVKNGDEAAGPSADLLKTALKTARERFSLHEQLPALADAVKNPKAQEAFVRNYVTSKTASIDTVERLVSILEPKALDGVRRNVLADILERAAPGAGRGSDAAVFSQAGYNRALDAIGDRKLLALFGEEGVSKLRQIGQVAEWVQKQPKGSAVNNSNSGAAVMNLLQGLAGKSENTLLNRLSGLPGVNIVRDSLAKTLDESAATSALRANVRPSTAQLTEEEIAALRRFMPLVGGASGSASSASLR